MYDPQFVVVLSAGEEAYYRNVLGYGDQAIQTLVDSRSAQYHSLHTRYGSVGNTFDPNYTYVLTQAETDQILGRIKIWEEDELLYGIGAGLLKGVADTQSQIEDANIIGRNITITTAAGGVGGNDGQIEIDTTRVPFTLTTDERVAFASAERDDLTFYNGTVEVPDPSAAGVVVTRIVIDQREDIDADGSGELAVTARDSAFVGSELSINVESIVAGGNVRVKSGEGVFNAAAPGAVNIAANNTVIEAADLTIGTVTDPLRIDLANTGTLTARASGDVRIEERNSTGTAGNLNVASVYSQSGGIFLQADGSIVDALNNDFAKLQAQTRIDLLADANIGETGDYLEIDGVGNATVNAVAAGNIRLFETDGNLNVDQIESTCGDVDLQAAIAIIDAVDDISGEPSRPATDIVGNHITLTALLGSIGQPGNEIDIDSAHCGSGELTTTSALDTYIIESGGSTPGVPDDLALNTVSTGTTYTAFISAPDGSIVNGNPTGSNVVSGSVLLKADDNIGSATQPITSNVGYIEGVTTQGNIWVVNTGNVELGGVDPSTSGVTSGGSINIVATGPIVVQESSTAVGPIVVQSIDSSDPDAESLVVASGVTLQSTGSTVTLSGGDDLTIQSGATVIAATTVVIQGDYADADPGVGADITINGSVQGAQIQVIGGDDDDNILIDVDTPNSSIQDYLVVLGGAGNDTITVNELESRSESVDLNGQEGSDDYIIFIRGDDAQNLINVLDSGSTGTDELTVYGRDDVNGPDNFLLRGSQTSYPAGIAFVAALHGDPAQFVERINYNTNLESLVVDARDGDDQITLDDNWTDTTVRGGQGEDRFQVGQIFKTERDAANANVAPGDEFETTLTTRGYLSNGVSYPTTIRGEDGNDTFVVFRNTAELFLFGGEQDDNFIIRAFASEGSQTSTLSAEGGQDYIEYVVNASVAVDGGQGDDTVSILGTEFSDHVVVTRDGVFGIGVAVSYTNIENLQVDLAEGNDIFYVLGTNANVVTKLFGGLGADQFSIGGDVPQLVSGTTVLFPATVGPHTTSGIEGELVIDGVSETGSAGGFRRARHAAR